MAGLGQKESAEAAAARLQSIPCQPVDTDCSDIVLQSQFLDLLCLSVTLTEKSLTFQKLFQRQTLLGRWPMRIMTLEELMLGPPPPSPCSALLSVKEDSL